MAEPTSSGSKAKNLPNFYSAVGGMDKYSGNSQSKPSSSPAADAGEKIKNVTTLLEVVKKMDAMESDAENKKLLEQVAGLVEQYMNKLQPGGGAGKGSGGGTGAEGGAAGAAGGGGGATVGDTTSASAAM